MYIDREPFAEMKVPNFTRVWTEISPYGNKIQYYKRELPAYISEIKNYIINYLKDTGGIQSIFDQDKNEMTLEVIKLTKCMVSYGFYKTKDELRDLSLALINLLNGTTDIYELVQDNDEPLDNFGSLIKKLKRAVSVEVKEVPRYNKSEDNLIIMKCKQYI